MAEQSRNRNRSFLLIFLVVALILAGIVSFYASSKPDGLEKVAEDEGFLGSARDHGLGGSPLSDYATAGIDDARLSVGVAGILGVLITLLIAVGLFLIVRRLSRDRGGVNSTSGPDPAQRT
jgi:hypothetical protein